VSVTGNPRPRVKWFFEKVEIQPDSRHLMESSTDSEQFSLIIRNGEEEDEGDYCCLAENQCGMVMCSAELVVIEV